MQKIVHSEVYQDDNDNRLEQCSRGLASHILLSLFEGGTNVSTFWLKKSFSRESSQGGLGPVSLSDNLTRILSSV